jgi:glycosyltransferase involved in cell wall biosynthesis
MTAPKVSVIMPVFNGQRFLAEALGSLGRGDEPELEVVVVDDGSTDDSIGIVQAVAQKDPRIRLLTGEHRGVSAARNVGLRASRGTYVAFLDCDDLCPPGRISRQLSKLISSPGAAFIVGETMWFEALTPDLKPAPGSKHVRLLCWHLHSALFASSVFDAHGHFDEALEFAEDMDFFLRLMEACVHFIVEDELASLYRRHDGNMTRNQHRMRRQMLVALQKSIARRRAAGHIGSLEGMFKQRLAVETTF